jgi:ribosome-associated protein
LNTDVKVQQQALSTEQLNALIIDSIQDIKGKNIVKLDLRRLEDAPTDFFIVCEGDSVVQIRAIAENIHRRVKEAAQHSPAHIEGLRGAHWVCLDYFATVVHIFYPERRSFYELESLWSDAIVTQYDSL